MKSFIASVLILAPVLALTAGTRSAGQAASESASQLVGPLPTTGKGVGVAIIDSGVAPHPDLADSLAASVVCTPNGVYDQDLLGHGTHVAGIVAGRGQQVRGVAPDARIISLQVVRGDLGRRRQVVWGAIGGARHGQVGELERAAVGQRQHVEGHVRPVDAELERELAVGRDRRA